MRTAFIVTAVGLIGLGSGACSEGVDGPTGGLGGVLGAGSDGGAVSNGADAGDAGGTGDVSGLSDGGASDMGTVDGSVLGPDGGQVDTGADGCAAAPPMMTDSPGTCTWQTHCGHGYWFCTNNRDWDAARSDCQGIGGDLLSINDQQEQDFVRTHATGGNQWIVGLNKQGASGDNAADVWEWVDASLAMGGYENFRNGEPDGNDCGAIDSGLWIDWACGNPENWICEVP